MAHATFLSFLSGAALALVLAPGCSNNNTPPAAVALRWTVSPGTNSSTVCGAVNDTFSIGNPEGNPIVTATTGTSYNGVPVTASCDVAPNSTGYTVNAQVTFGGEGSLAISGQISVGANSVPGTQSNISGSFDDHVPGGLIADMSESNCTVTFTANPNMGIAPTRIWGVIDCPQEAASNGTVCDGNAEFLFENCGQ